MKRYFYTDPLAAAWMAKHFGMRYMMQEVSAMDSYTITTEHKKGSCGIGDSPDYVRLDFGGWSVPSKHYIHPDSLHLLEPQLWDVIEGNNGDYYCTGYWQICEGSTVKISKTDEIIKRNNKPFFTPESEEV